MHNMKRLSPYKYTEFRRFLDDFLKLRKLTYKQFVEKYKIVSFGFFSNIMAKDRSGKFRKTRKPTPEVLVQLLKSIGLRDEECFYLLLCLIENDSEPAEGKYGSALRSILRKNIKNYSKLNLLAPSNKDDLYQMTGEIIKELPIKYQKRIFNVVYQQIELATDSGFGMDLNFDVDNYLSALNRKKG